MTTSKMILFLTITILFTLILVTSNAAQWERIKSPEIKVPISTYAAAAKGDTLFIGTYGGTIFLSTDNGLTWTKSDSGISFLYRTYDFLINGNNIYSMGEEGIFLSTNWGKTWEQKNNGLPASSWKIVYSMVQLDSVLFAATDFGVYQSSNNGDKWYPSNGDSSFWPVYSIVVLNGSLFAGSEEGVFKSTNKGLSWNAFNNGMPYNSIRFTKRINKLSVDGEIIIAGTNQWGIYYSSNGGDLWIPDTLGLKVNNNGYHFPIHSISRIGKYIFAGTQDDGIYYQINSGSKWTPINFGLGQYAYVTSIINNGDTVFAVSYDGLYKSSINNIAWIPAFTEFPEKVNINVVGSSADNLFIYASSNYYNGTITKAFSSFDMGNNWNLDSVLSTLYINQFKSFGDSLYAFGGGLFFSSSNGSSWVQIDSMFINSLIKSNDTLFTGLGYDYWQWGERGGIFFSPDNGKSWSEIWKGDTAVYALAKIENNLFSGGLHGVLRSDNLGNSWIAANKGLPSLLKINSFNSIGNNLFLNSSRGIYRLNSNENSWTAINEGLPLSEDTLLLNKFCLFTNKEQLYVGTKQGVYFSTDLGENWNSSNNGLMGNALSIKAFAILNNDLVIATNDGLWYRSINEINSLKNGKSSFPNSYYLSQNYPNPFNPTTTIQYLIPKQSFVTIKLYDILGKECATLVNESKNAGIYYVEFNATNLPSGVYFYRMQAGSFVSTKKFVLLK